MIDMRHKPYNLPQVSAPFDIVIEQLKDIGVDCEYSLMDSNLIQPSQGFTFCDDFDMNNFDKDNDPIWIAGETPIENVALDGHHRWVNYLSTNQPMKVVKLKMKPRDAIRALNKVQDVYEYKQQLELEEVTQQDYLNARNDKDNFEGDWLSEVELMNSDDNNPDTPKNPMKIKGYRDKPLKESSVIGNFFSLTPTENYDKYDIEFDNILDTSNIGVQYYSGQSPIDIFATVWFPNIDFVSLSEKLGVDQNKLKMRCITEKAKKMGYDGIKYGDNLLQGLN